MSNERPRVVVIGGGITGLVAARNLQRDHNVVVIEATDRLGGKIATANFRERPLDVGADAFITRNPAAMDLCLSLGLGEYLIEPSASSAAIYTRQRIHPLPKGLVFGIPTDPITLLKSRTVGLWGVIRMLGDLISLRPAVADDIATSAAQGSYDPTVAEILTPRFGRRIVSRLIDPLIGGINASDVRQLSFYGAMPQIAEQLRSKRSVVRGLASTRQPPSATAPSIFRGLANGMEQLIETIAADLHAGDTTIYCNEPVLSIDTSTTSRFLVATAHQHVAADHIILATPAYVSARIVSQLSPSLARELDEIPYTSVATVTFAWSENDVTPYIARRLASLVGHRSPNAVPSPTERLLPGSGVLIARDESLMTTAASFTSTKWPRSATTGEVTLRASLGHHGDERSTSLTDGELVVAIQKELTRILKMDAAPLDVYVQRWPQSFPQYIRGHIARVHSIEQLAGLLGIELAGAAYHGIGIPSCIDNANAVAERIRRASLLKS